MNVLDRLEAQPCECDIETDPSGTFSTLLCQCIRCHAIDKIEHCRLTLQKNHCRE